jgi:hypothetical protein
MLRSAKTSQGTHDDATLFVCIRFLATWFLGGAILSVIFGLWIGSSLGLLIALGYVKAVHWNAVLSALSPRSSGRPRQRDSAAIER